MKKFILMAFTLLMLGLASCETSDNDINDPNPYCFEVEIEAKMNGDTKDKDFHFWGTGAEVQVFADNLRAQYEAMGAKVTVVIQKTLDLTEAACYAGEIL